MVGGLLAGVCYMPLMGVSIEVKQTYKVRTITMWLALYTLVLGGV